MSDSIKLVSPVTLQAKLEKTSKSQSDLIKEALENKQKVDDVDTLVSNENEFIGGLDSFEFTWNKTHPLRNVYKKLRREMYAKYDCLNNDNMDLRLLVDQVIVLNTQLSGIGRMTLDGKGPKNLPYRVAKHQTKLLELMTVILKYTRKEPEKSLKKTMVNKGKQLADTLKDKLPEHARKQLSDNLKKAIAEKYKAMDDESAPFEQSYEEDEDIEDNE